MLAEEKRLKEKTLREEAAKALSQVEVKEEKEIDEWLKVGSADTFDEKLKQYLKGNVQNIPGYSRRNSLRPASSSQKEKGKRKKSFFESVSGAYYDEEDIDIYTRGPFEGSPGETPMGNDESSSEYEDEEDYSPFGENEVGVYDDGDDNTPAPPIEAIVNVYQTVELANERIKIMRRLSTQVMIVDIV
jgi:hypothetical protein